MAYNCRDGWPTIAEMSGLDTPKYTCSPDNSMGEGFFGTIKNEFFYSRDWSKYKCDDFIIELDKYLNWFKYKRIKYRLSKTII